MSGEKAKSSPGPEDLLPFEREVAYVASMAAVGGIFAFISWAICSYLWPHRNFEWALWTFIGGGLAGTIGITWVATNALY